MISRITTMLFGGGVFINIIRWSVVGVMAIILMAAWPVYGNALKAHAIIVAAAKDAGSKTPREIQEGISEPLKKLNIEQDAVNISKEDGDVVIDVEWTGKGALPLSSPGKMYVSVDFSFDNKATASEVMFGKKQPAGG